MKSHHMDLFVQTFTIYKEHTCTIEIHYNIITIQWAKNGWINILSTNDLLLSASVQLTETGNDIIKFMTEL